MDITTLSSILGSNTSTGSTSSISDLSEALSSITGGSTTTTGASAFESLYSSAINMIEETNELTNQAEEEELNFAMGYTDNVHDLLVAQQKANISLQYTVAVRNAVMDAYKEIMNLQF